MFLHVVNELIRHKHKGVLKPLLPADRVAVEKLPLLVSAVHSVNAGHLRAFHRYIGVVASAGVDVDRVVGPRHIEVVRARAPDRSDIFGCRYVGKYREEPRYAPLCQRLKENIGLCYAVLRGGVPVVVYHYRIGSYGSNVRIHRHSRKRVIRPGILGLRLRLRFWLRLRFRFGLRFGLWFRLGLGFRFGFGFRFGLRINHRIGLSGLIRLFVTGRNEEYDRRDRCYKRNGSGNYIY